MKHRSRRLHGHSFLAKARAQLNGKDWADFPGDGPKFFRDRLENCVRALDYRYLNDIISVPTDENLARFRMARVVDIPGVDTISLLHWMRNELGETLPELDRIDLYETPGCGAFLQWGEHGPALPAQHS